MLTTDLKNHIDMASRIFCYTQLVDWGSSDGRAFERVSTLIESASGKSSGDEGKRRETWTPYPICNEDEGRWNLFYAEHGGPLGSRAIRAVSQTPGSYAYADTPPSIATTAAPSNTPLIIKALAPSDEFA